MRDLGGAVRAGVVDDDDGPVVGELFAEELVQHLDAPGQGTFLVVHGDHDVHRDRGRFDLAVLGCGSHHVVTGHALSVPLRL
jgi:hypothetical protein